MRTHAYRAAAAALSLVVAGCTPEDAPDEQVTSLRVAVGVASTAQEVARVTLSAAGPGTYGFELAAGAGAWSGGGAVAPGEYYVHAQAFDAEGALRFEGSAGPYLVSHGATTLVALTAQSLKPPVSFGNTPPRITAVYVSSLSADPGGSIRLIAAAFDPDPGSSLTYLWTASDGSFDDDASPRTSWTAPVAEGVVSLSLTVTDEKGAKAEAAFSVTVGEPTGELLAEVSFNSPPDVYLVAATPTRVALYEPAYLSAELSDPDGDELFTSWWSSCPGWFETYGPSPAFYAYGTSQPDGRCDLHLDVWDGKGGYGSGRTTVWVGPPAPAKVLPAQIVNGSFETGDYTGWTVVQAFGAPADATQGIGTAGQTVWPGEWTFDFADQLWVPQYSPGLPLTFQPTDGERVAFLLANGPSRTRMYQDLAIPADATTLAWDMAYTNHHGALVANQQGITVNVRDLASDAIVGGVFRLEEGAPVASGMSRYEADVSAWAGQEIRLNFTVHQLLYHFDVVIDDVRIY